MQKHTNAKYKLDRSLGQNVLGRPKSSFNVRQSQPGKGMAAKSFRTKSDFKVQLTEQQKIRQFYGSLRLRDLRRMVHEAITHTGKNTDNIIAILESRLKTIVYRAKWGVTHWAASQLVSHGHILVNNKKVNIGSFRVKVNDVIEIENDMRENSAVKLAMNNTEREIPNWLIKDGTWRVVVNKFPLQEEVFYPTPTNLRVIVEKFSK